MEEKSVLIDKDIHKKLKDFSKRSGISIKHIVEKGIELYIRKIEIKEGQDENFKL